MKTILQIQKKIELMKTKLKQTPICENFGEKQQFELWKYIGDLWSYDYDNRQKIMQLTNNFFNWCIYYTE